MHNNIKTRAGKEAMVEADKSGGVGTGVMKGGSKSKGKKEEGTKAPLPLAISIDSTCTCNSSSRSAA
jgi:hypothetical protein